MTRAPYRLRLTSSRWTRPAPSGSSVVPPGAGTETGWPFIVIDEMVVATRARTGLRSLPRIRTELSTPRISRPTAGTDTVSMRVPVTPLAKSRLASWLPRWV